MRATEVLEWLQKVIQEHGAPAHQRRSDNGRKFIAKVVEGRLNENGLRTLYIEYVSPWQKGLVESFHGRFRDECLNQGAAPHADRGSGGHRGLPPGVQPTQAAQPAGLS